MNVSQINTHEWTREDWERAAQEYADRLTVEDEMEGMFQGTQRMITLQSLDAYRGCGRSLQVFNELLIQYVHKGQVRGVVPDNMARLREVVLYSKMSFVWEEEPEPIFWVIEYVSSPSPNKDYAESLTIYEQLRIPYCLQFDPRTEPRQLCLYRHNGERYERVPANASGRHPIPELEMEVGVFDGWGRFWHRGEMLLTSRELMQRLLEEQQRRRQAEQAAEAERRREQASQQAVGEWCSEQGSRSLADLQAEIASLRELLAQLQQQPKPGTP
jgi:Uma2 family endonuclease